MSEKPVEQPDRSSASPRGSAGSRARRGSTSGRTRGGSRSRARAAKPSPRGSGDGHSGNVVARAAGATGRAAKATGRATAGGAATVARLVTGAPGDRPTTDAGQDPESTAGKAKSGGTGRSVTSAAIALPGPGAVITLGRVRLRLPTGSLYYGGLAGLAVTGTIEVPIAVGAAVAGAVLARRWLSRPLPTVDLFDSRPGTGPG